MGSMALDDCHQIPMTRRLFRRSECNTGLWSFSVIHGARLFCLGMLALILGLASGVEGISFAFNGFKGFPDVYTVSNSNWIYNASMSSFVLDNAGHYLGVRHNARSRFWYPELVQMKDPVTTAVKSFRVSFIFQILRLDISHMTTGSKLAFVMVPDDVTAGTRQDHMGLVTTNTTEPGPKYYDSDVHTLGVEFDDSDVHGTFGVEFDTHMNPEFNDPNVNHVGILLGCMDHTSTFDPVPLSIVTENEDLLNQVWIDYFQVDSRIDIYASQYGQGKPAKPQESKTGVDMSILKENMNIGFSAGAERDVLVTIFAWSFSTDGPAPPIYNARDGARPSRNQANRSTASPPPSPTGSDYISPTNPTLVTQVPTPSPPPARDSSFGASSSRQGLQGNGGAREWWEKKRVACEGNTMRSKPKKL